MSVLILYLASLNNTNDIGEPAIPKNRPSILALEPDLGTG
jgi:hypothetical protein